MVSQSFPTVAGTSSVYDLADVITDALGSMGPNMYYARMEEGNCPWALAKLRFRHTFVKPI